MTRYDAIIVLGYGFLEDWILPGHVKEQLIICTDLFKSGYADKIVLSGKWGIDWDRKNITPPITEAELMKSFLLTLGIPEDKILKEESSRDTLSNAYYLKKDVIVPNSYKNLLIICADYAVARVEYLFFKVFGVDFNINIFATHTTVSDEILNAQLSFLDETREFLKEMKTGDDTFLNDLFFSSPFYQKERPLVEKAAIGIL